MLSSDNKHRSRDSSNIVCAVDGCSNSKGMKENRKVTFFDIPSSKTARNEWLKMIPSLGDVQSSNKVCERHFIDGEPTAENPTPTLFLVNAEKRKFEETVEIDEDEEPPAKKVLKLDMAGMKWRKAEGTVPTLNFKKAILPGTGRVVRVARLPPSLASSNASSVFNSSSRPPGKNLASALADVLGQSSSTRTRNHRCSEITDAACPRCLSMLPSLRKGLGRIEVRLDSIIAMVRQLNAKQIVNGAASSSMSMMPMVRTVGVPSMRARPAGVPSIITNKAPISMQNMLFKTVMRSILLCDGAEFTVEECRKAAPSSVKALSLTKLIQMIEELIREGFIAKVDQSVSTNDPECIFEKRTTPRAMAKLSKYGVSVQEYRRSTR